MDRTIHKYPLEVVYEQTIEMPAGAVILCVQMQRETPCMWAVVDSEAQLESRMVRIFGTGHSLPQNTRTSVYVGTFQMKGGALVFHAFVD
jgi:hypothetical protein